MNLISSIHRD